jgi:hypothetical protein
LGEKRKILEKLRAWFRDDEIDPFLCGCKLSRREIFKLLNCDCKMFSAFFTLNKNNQSQKKTLSTMLDVMLFFLTRIIGHCLKLCWI